MFQMGSMEVTYIYMHLIDLSGACIVKSIIHGSYPCIIIDPVMTSINPPKKPRDFFLYEKTGKSERVVIQFPNVPSKYPILSMYGIFLYISLMSMVNVGKYSIHGASGI